MDRDLALALKLQREYDEEFSNTKKKKSFMDLDVPDSRTSIVDPTLEFTDPTPDIHKMFVGFDKRFFWSSLGSVEVMWSPRMTQCAGICRYRSGNGATTVHLSLPLLKLRPRKDLVETLLHEMIHAYLFVTRNNKDRDGHGPEFQSHMRRINNSAGINITIYHSFHNEVNLYKTHWWRCNGPCQQQRPFYGLVKRTMNRAPGPNDFWFPEHQRRCGGEFIKIKEPENYKSRKQNRGAGSEKGKATSSKRKKMPDFFKPSVPKAKPTGGLQTASGGSSTRTVMTVSKLPKNDEASSSGQPIRSSSPKPNIVPFSGAGHTLGKTTLPVSDKPWLKRFNDTPSSMKNNAKNPMSDNSVNDKPWLKRFNNTPSSMKNNAKNPVAPNKKLNNHLPCSSLDSKKPKIDEKNNKNVEKRKEVDEDIYKVSCPVCNKSVVASQLNNHLDGCLNGNNEDDETVYSRCVICDSKLDKDCSEPVLCSICELAACSTEFDIPASENEDRSISCPICEIKMNNGDLERHLEVCIEDACADKNTTRFANEDDDDEIIVEWVKPKNELPKKS